ncbi:diacylglycerol kinase [Streptomyces sp. WAC 06738]|uniref:diacylglycerol kinase n=1 Tax=Streptomyces sp. WAC 06738 TaxID=2203210 RepID=UPI000F6ECE05|nr:diacylglycerol kinase [Streptomyces sp. WAC 06738]AZM45091.1 diacylglycerol kinase [Streptomyces sp. WAC 06738]
MTSDITVFVNPTAGRGRGAKAAPVVTEALRDAGYEVATVQGSDAATALAGAREAVAAGTGALISVGGDGMAALALQAVAGTEVPVGIVAVGTGNDFARATGLPVRDPAAAAEVVVGALESGSTRAIDLGKAGDTYFGTVLASGFDSRVNDRGNRMAWPPGRFKYDVAMVAELASFRPIPYRMRLDDGPETEIEATLVAVGNGPSYGGGMRICHEARMDDGLFDITVVGRCSRRTLLRVFPRVYKGTHLTHPAVTVHRAARVSLSAADVTGYADGEPLGPLPLTAEVVPGAARVLVR